VQNGPKDFDTTSQTRPAFRGVFAVVGYADVRQRLAMADQPAGSNLYTRLGGMTSVQLIMAAFVANVSRDARINQLLSAAEIKRLSGLLTDVVIEVTGGPPNPYKVRSGQAGLLITMTDFNALIEDLDKALDSCGVAEAERSELLSLLAP